MRNLVTRTDKKIRYFAMLIKNESIFERKSDARKKIMLGGLLVKAGFDHMHPQDASVLYGMLLDCKRALKEKPELMSRWRKMGKALLTGKNDKFMKPEQKGNGI